jgi:cyclic pyranopterin monophosphate synthase
VVVTKGVAHERADFTTETTEERGVRGELGGRELFRSRSKRVKRKLSHYTKGGEVSMVDVSAKEVTTRTATAHAFVRMAPRVVRAVRELKNPKGNPLEVARIAGIAAAKRTSEWIPLCHPLPITHIDVTPRLCKDGVEVVSTVAATAQTGVEMEALVAVSCAALTVYDMCKALDKSIEISAIHLLRKTGGKSGDFVRAQAATSPSRSRKK